MTRLTLAVFLGLASLGSPALAQQPARGPSPLLMEKPLRTVVTADHSPSIAMVKFAHGSQVRLRSGVLAHPEGDEVLGLINDYLSQIGASIRPMIELPEATLDTLRQRGERRRGHPLHDLNLFYRIDLPAAASMAEVCDALNSFEIVTIAYPTGTLSDPVAAVEIVPRSASPDFRSNQVYRTAAPAGVDADHALTFPGGRGAGVTIADVETAWTDDHEDLIDKAEDNFIGFLPANYPWDHGTAVLGELIGADDGSGVLGLCPDADVLMSSHQGVTSQIPTAIMTAATTVGTGDVVVIEVQCFQGPPSPHPCEFDPGIFATVETATANGIHVFAAAGNGSNDLDSAAYGGAFDRNVRDSGAVMVGASNGGLLERASFSNYGSRCDAHGWGFNVATCGYGDLQSGPATQEYTAAFSGTSSATPIVTGAGIVIDTIHRSAYGAGMDPFTLRQLLTDTGTPQVDTENIGPRPDVKSALRSLEIPEVEVTGSFVPGGAITITSYGTSGDPYGVLVSPSLLASPIAFGQYGVLFLDNPIWVFFGTIGAGGSDSVPSNIPNNPALSGATGYMQSLQAFNTKTGQGHFSNYFQIDVQ